MARLKGFSNRFPSLVILQVPVSAVLSLPVQGVSTNQWENVWAVLGADCAAFCLEFFSAAAVFGQRLSGLHVYDLMTQITQFLPLALSSHLGTELGTDKLLSTFIFSPKHNVFPQSVSSSSSDTTGMGKK